MNQQKGIVIKTPVSRAAVSNRRQHVNNIPRKSHCGMVSIMAYSLLLSCVAIFLYVAGSNVFTGDAVSPVHIANLLRKVTLSPEIVQPPQPPMVNSTSPSRNNDEPARTKKERQKTGNKSNNNNSNRGKKGGKEPAMQLLKKLDFGPEPHIALIPGEKDGTI